MGLKLVSMSVAVFAFGSLQVFGAGEREKELSKSDCGVIKEVGGRRACRFAETNFQIIIPNQAYEALPDGEKHNGDQNKLDK